MEQNTMLILLFSLILQCDLLNCANSSATLDIENEYKSPRNVNLTNYSITEVLLSSNTSETHQTDLVTQDFNITLKNEPYSHEVTPSLPTTLSPFYKSSAIATSSKIDPIIHQREIALRSPSRSSNPSSVDNSRDVSTTVKTIDIPNLMPSRSTPDETRFSSAKIERSFSGSIPGFGPRPVGYPAETPPINFDPNVAEFAKEWLQGLASTTGNTPKKLVPKLSKILDYDHATQGFPLISRRNRQNITNAKPTSYQIPFITDHGATTPEISKRSYTESKANKFWHDPPTTSVKPRLRPGLLLGKATISAVRNEEDFEGKEKTLEIEGREKIMRMHQAMTKKQWYSDRTVQEEMLETTTAATEKEILRESFTEYLREIKKSKPKTTTISSTPTFDTTTASSTQTDSKMADTTPSSSTVTEESRSEGYLIEFLIELLRLIAKKEKKYVHDVLKHADQIIHGFHKTGQLQWFGQPLIDVTRKLARMLKDTEIDIIQNNAEDLHHSLTHRPRMLSEEVSRILETAASLYDDDDGAHLSEVLGEFAAYPNSTLSSYWLCNNLINHFLRPYRRLADSVQRQQLLDSINRALKTRFPTSGADERNGVRSAGGWQTKFSPESPGETNPLIHKQSPHETKRAPRERKKKHHHRSRKKKRNRERHRMQRYRIQSMDFEGNSKKVEDLNDLTLRSMTSSTGQPRVLVGLLD